MNKIMPDFICPYQNFAKSGNVVHRGQAGLAITISSVSWDRFDAEVIVLFWLCSLGFRNE